MTEMPAVETSAAPGRINGKGPVAVIDIGSNSIRLVVYERHSRALTSLYNEKVLAGLIRGIDESGELSAKSIQNALDAVQRFKTMIDKHNVKKVFIIATAAARDAKNGSFFIKKIEDICQSKVEILTGRQEAYYSAMGVISGFHNPRGIAGDMGGGSLELVEVEGQSIGQGKTFALGGIRLQEASSGKPVQSLEIARKLLAKTKWLKDGKGKSFYAVGGTWRSIARHHQAITNYPLRVMHEYTIQADDAYKLCMEVVNQDTENSTFPGVSRSRRQLLPYGASVLAAIIESINPSKIVLSALGIREGLLYNFLSQDEKDKDPLLEAAWELGLLRSRSPQYIEELKDWTSHVFQVLNIKESEEDKRLRTAACLLVDIGWRAHPDYRGEQSMNIITNAGFVGLNHSSRAFLGLTTYYRNHGLVDEVLGPNVQEIATKHHVERAKLLGAILRLSHSLCGSMPGVIPSIRMQLVEDQLQLIIPKKLEGFAGERGLKRLKQLARIFELQGKIMIES